MSTSINCFQKIFLEYCFDEEIDVSGEMEREYIKGDSIPDFYFIDKNYQEYIIENKLYDRGDHFEQYKIAFPNAKRTFIANYVESEHDGWKIKTWKEFVPFLEKKLSIIETDEDRVFLNGFTSYLKSVINYLEAKNMDLSNLSSLNNFYIVINEIFSESKTIEFIDYNISSAFNSEYYGKYAYFLNNKKQNVIIWLGLYIPDDSGVYIKFQKYQDNAWLPKRERSIIENIKEGKYFDQVSIEGGNVYIHLREEYFQILCSKNDIKEQKEILKCFLDEIILLLK